MQRWFPGIVSPPVAIVIALIVGVGVGLINANLSVLLKINSFLVTLGMLIVLRGLCAYLIPEGLYYLPKGFIALGDAKVFGFPVALIVFIIAVVGVYILVNKTEFGTNLYAVGSSEKAAYLFGINVGKIKAITFVLAGLFAALGGLTATGRMQAVIADMGDGDIITVFAACFLGGMSMSGGKGEIVDLIGSILTLSMITNILNLIGVNPFLVRVIYGFILLLAIILANLQEQFRQRLLLGTYKSMKRVKVTADAS
jgi:ribose/xylose/arabinose/galactoside ABC-type transport system permease subunit